MKKWKLIVFVALCLMSFFSVTFYAESPVHEHQEGEKVITPIQLPTCMAEGSYQETTLCAICGEKMSVVSVTVPVVNHTPAEPVRENVIPATCAKVGAYDSVFYCSVCGAELQRTEKVIPKLSYHVSEYSLKRTVTRNEDGKTVVTFADPAYPPLEKTGSLPDAFDGATAEADRFLCGDGSGRTCVDGEERCALCGELLNPAIPHQWDKGSWTAPDEEYPWASFFFFQCLFCGEKKSLSSYTRYYPYGDVNGDYAVTAEDARLALRASVQIEEYDLASRVFCCADYDGNGQISAADAREILLTSVNQRDIRWVGYQYVDYSKGNVDYDNMVTPADARLVLRYSVGLGDHDKVISDENRRNADYDGDGEITPADARLILRVAVGLPV